MGISYVDYNEDDVEDRIAKCRCDKGEYDCECISWYGNGYEDEFEDEITWEIEKRYLKDCYPVIL